MSVNHTPHLSYYRRVVGIVSRIFLEFSRAGDAKRNYSSSQIVLCGRQKYEGGRILLRDNTPQCEAKAW